MISVHYDMNFTLHIILNNLIKRNNKSVFYLKYSSLGVGSSLATTETLAGLSPPFTSLPPNCVKFSFVSIMCHYSSCPSLLLTAMIICQLQGTTTMHQQHRHVPPRFQTTTSHHTPPRFQTATSYHTPLVIPRQ